MNYFVGLGIDIEAIDRFRKMNFDNNIHFYNKIFTSEEIEYCLSQEDCYPHFAVRFCAKEAFIKAIDTGIDNLHEITIGVRNGKPVINFREKVYSVSMSHNQNNAIAIVII